MPVISHQSVEKSRFKHGASGPCVCVLNRLRVPGVDTSLTRTLAYTRMYTRTFSEMLPRSVQCGIVPIRWDSFSLFLKKLINLFIFRLCWVFVAARGLSLVAVSGGYSSLRCTGFSLRWLLSLRSTGSRCTGFSSCGAWA